MKKKKQERKTGKARPVGRAPMLGDAHRKIQKRMVEALSIGHYVEVAVVLAGISITTYYGWIARGQKEENRINDDIEAGIQPQPDEKEAKYLEFLHVTREACAKAEQDAILCIKKAFDHEDWRAAAMFLERRHPRRWKRTDAHEIGGPNGGPIKTQSENIDLAGDMTAEQATDAYLQLMKKNAP